MVSLQCLSLSKNIEALFLDGSKIVIRIITIPKHNWTVKITNKNTEDRKAIYDALEDQKRHFENFILKNLYKLETIMRIEGNTNIEKST